MSAPWDPKPTLTLSTDERIWLRRKWDQIRQAQVLADEANNKWKRVNAEINDWMASKGITDTVQRSKIKGESLALGDALSVGNWHSRNAERHIHDVQLFLRMKELGVL